MLLALQQDVIYGPLRSRRYGISLGLNLMPCSYKLCSFDCVYCHYGRTGTRALDLTPHREDLPHPEYVIGAMERALQRVGRLDLITFSGNGESTLHPEFAALVDEVVALRDRYQPDARVALLSNSTGLLRAEVRRALARIDLPVLKLDAGTERTFGAVNRPARAVHFDEIVDFLAAQPDIIVQTVMIAGAPANTGAAELAAYYALLARIRPREVHLYSIDRPVPDARIALVPPGRLKAIAQEGQRRTGVPIKAYFEEKQA